jgi:hypothetical protein
VTASNKQLALVAKDYAARSDGVRRRAWLCIAVALGTTTSVPGAARALDVIELRDVKQAALKLLDELAGEQEAATASSGSNG